MCPERRISSAEYHTPSNLYAIREINLVSGSDNASVTQNKYRIDLIDNFRVGDGIDLVHPDYLAVAAQTHVRAAANDIQMSDADMVFNREFLYARDDVEVSDGNIVVDAAFAGIDNADPDPNSFANLVAEEQAIKRTFEERRQQRATSEHQQTEFASSVHRVNFFNHKFTRMNTNQIGVQFV